MIKIDTNRLFEETLKARESSYSPYSNFAVGAVVLLKNGEYIHGTNVENAAYPSGMCAERIAMFTTYAKGYRKEDIVAIACTGDTKLPISPCAGCRQVMIELLDLETPVYLFNLKKDMKVFKVKELVPYLFDKEDL